VDGVRVELRAVGEVEVVELRQDVVPVGRFGSRGIGLVIGGLAAVIGLGFSGGGAPSHPLVTRSASSAAPVIAQPSQRPRTVAATTRLFRGPGGARVVVSGGALPGVDRIVVSLRIRGEVVATADLMAGSADPRAGDVSAWSTVLDVPPLEEPSDAVAALDVDAFARGARTGSLSLPLVLGDGRGRDG
jgi:hypothetical protein